MEENQQQNPQGLPVVTVEAAKQKMAIALTKLSLSSQKMQDEADALIFNEDHVETIKEFLAKVKKAEKSIEDEHEIGKKPYFQAGKAWDNAKNQMLQIIGGTKTPVLTKYTALCNEIDRRNREEEAATAKKQAIKDGIESNVLDFSKKIANCFTKKDLTDVERLINLEKSESRASKYGDLHQQAIDRFNDALLPIIRDQKAKIEEKEALEKQLEAAVDPEKHEEIKEKLEAKENEIMQNQVKVQEDALTPIIQPEEANVIRTSVKAKRTYIVPEIVDLALAFKKQRALLNIDLKLLEAKKIGETLRSAGAFGDKDELTVDGIKYTIKKTW